MIKRKCCYFMFLILFPSCEWDKKENEVEEVKEEKRESEVNAAPYFEQILFDEIVEDEQMVAHIQEEEKFKIEVSGVRIISQFSSIYSKASTSTWTKEECKWDSSWEDVRCHSWTKEGGCESQFRDYLGEKEEEILLKEFQLNYQVGKEIYPLGEILEHGGKGFMAVLQVTEKMLENGDELKLVVIKPSQAKEVKVGFLGHSHCDGVGALNFNPHIDTKSWSVPVVEKEIYKVNLFIEREAR